VFHIRKKLRYGAFRPADSDAVAVNSLVFHSEKPTWLFCEFVRIPMAVGREFFVTTFAPGLISVVLVF
jgi:hypothetical protein